jgi:hypothetical protein
MSQHLDMDKNISEVIGKNNLEFSLTIFKY